MEYENRLMQEDNLSITDKNKALFTCLKNMNKEISNEEKTKLDNHEKMVSGNLKRRERT
jgi:hypothetical protein